MLTGVDFPEPLVVESMGQDTDAIDQAKHNPHDKYYSDFHLLWTDNARPPS
jgi:hypothetical protein